MQRICRAVTVDACTHSIGLCHPRDVEGHPLMKSRQRAERVHPFSQAIRAWADDGRASIVEILTPNGSRSGGVALLRPSRSALRRSELGHGHGQAIGARMHGSAPWKTEETIVGLPRLLVRSVFSRSDSPDLVAVTFHLWWLSPFTSLVAVTFEPPTFGTSLSPLNLPRVSTHPASRVDDLLADRRVLLETGTQGGRKR